MKTIFVSLSAAEKRLSVSDANHLKSITIPKIERWIKEAKRQQAAASTSAKKLELAVKIQKHMARLKKLQLQLMTAKRPARINLPGKNGAVVKKKKSSGPVGVDGRVR